MPGPLKVNIRDVDRGRPSRLPCALALARPARTRSAMRARSNSAIAPSTCSCSLPAGVVASMPSARLMKATPTAWSSSSNRIRWRRLRPSRSRRQHTSTSNRRRLAFVTSWSSAGRLSLAPLTPRSTYSAGAHPRASMYRLSSCSWFCGSWSRVEIQHRMCRCMGCRARHSV